MSDEPRDLSSPVTSYATQPRQRPDGSVLIFLGSTLLVIAVILFVIAVSEARSLASSWVLTLVGGGLFQLGLVLALAGAIVRAIWFLPGDDTKMPPDT